MQNRLTQSAASPPVHAVWPLQHLWLPIVVSVRVLQRLRSEAYHGTFCVPIFCDRVLYTRAYDDPVLVAQEPACKLHQHLKFAGVRHLDAIVFVAEGLEVSAVILPTFRLVSQLAIQKAGKHLL
jgi:hypothetical protein